MHEGAVVLVSTFLQDRPAMRIENDVFHENYSYNNMT